MEKAGLFLSWSQLLWVTVIVVLLYVTKQLVQFYFIHRHNTQDIDPSILKRLADIEHELEIMQDKLDILCNEQDDPIKEAAKSGSVQLDTGQERAHYAVAIDMAKAGKSINEIADKCEIPLAEADLIVAIYRGVYKG